MKNNKKNDEKKLNKNFKKVGIIIFSIIFVILALYFVTSYNSTIVYSFSLNNEKFTLEEGIIIKSNMYNIMTFGNLEMSNSEEDNYYVEFLIGDKFIVGADSKSLRKQKIIEQYGYDEYFTKKEFKNILDDFIIKIYVPKDNTTYCGSEKEKCEVYEYKLYVREEFRNNKLVYLKGMHI